MIRYQDLRFTTPRTERNLEVQRSYATTCDEIVRRTEDTVTGVVTYAATDLCQVIGGLDLSERNPSVKGPWCHVRATDETPE
jgi:hypothetical protein